MKPIKKLVIWDLSDENYKGESDALIWGKSNCNQPTNCIPIDLVIKRYQADVRNSYFMLTEEYGEVNINGSTLIEYLHFDDRLSYWWQTLVMQKCNFAKSPDIESIIKVLALDYYCSENDVSYIELYTSSKALVAVINSLCKSRAYKFAFKKNKSAIYINLKNKSIRSVVRQITPRPILAVLWLGYYLFHRWNIRGIGLENWIAFKGSTTFFSYLNNLPDEKTYSSHSKNIYWGSLPEVTQSLKINTRWLHIWVSDKTIANAKKVIKITQEFNSSNSGRQAHIILDAFLSIKIVLKVLYFWVKYSFRYRACKSELSILKFHGINYWPMLKNEFNRSFFSIEMLRNLLNTMLIDGAISTLDIQEKAFYLQENQPWECGLISSWRKYGHKTIYGVPHTVIRFWDLRYFNSADAYRSNASLKLPMPSFMLVNGEAQQNQMQLSGYPSEQLVKVEALRYLHLNNIAKNKKKKSNRSFKVLLLGDYSYISTRNMFDVINNSSLHCEIKLIFKSHPYCQISNKEYPNLNFLTTNENIKNIISDVDLVCSSNMTTAVLEAYYAGVPIISILNQGALDMSPILASSMVKFVKDSIEFEAALANFSSELKIVENNLNYFDINPEIPEWKKILVS
jgi:surface carbohydrate biosynthesis protein (TIGR04326 family)